MTTDERLEALVVTVENIAGLVKDMLERRDAAEAQSEADRQEMRAGIAALTASVEALVRIAAGHDERLNVLASTVETLVKVGAQHDERLALLTEAVEKVLDTQLRQQREIDALVSVQPSHDERIKALAEGVSASKAQADIDRKAMMDGWEMTRETVAALSATVVRLAEGSRERFEQLEARADHDRRAMREVVEGLKDMIYTAHDRADGAHKRIDKLESDAA